MTEYFDEGTHFWEYQTIDTDDGAITWERFDPIVQEWIYNELKENDEVIALKIEDTDIEIIFDHGGCSHLCGWCCVVDDGGVWLVVGVVWCGVVV